MHVAKQSVVRPTYMFLLFLQAILMGIGLQHKTMDDLEVS